MVTGIETAGLVLAVLPLVISALESYKEGLQTINRLYHSESQLRKLIRTLKVQRTKYRTNLEKLIKAAAPDLGLQEIPEDFSSPIWRGQLNAKARVYLGDRYESFNIVVEDYQEYLKEIANKLRHINRPRTAKKTDLKALLAGNPTTDGTFTWLKKIDFTMKDKDLRRLADQLDSSNLTLSSFINDSDMLERLVSQPNDSLSARMLSDSMRKIRLHADYLHEAISRARHPTCSASHRVMLHLEDRLPVKHSSPKGQAKTIDQSVNFCLSVAWQSRDPSCRPCWHEARVTVSSSSSAYQVHVDDICRLIDQAQQLNCTIKFHLRDNTLLRFHNPKEKLQPPKREVETTTLQELLKSSTKLQPKDSTTLALKLASSLLQLNFTFWLEKRWSKSDISFFRLTSPPVVYIRQPLLEQVFHVQTAPNPSLRTAMAILDILFEFGILLMEIYTHTTFEDWMARNGESCVDDSYYARLRPAMMWYDREKDIYPLEYRKVVSRCLKRNFEEYNTSWDDQRFREAVCVNIIEPLQQTCEVW